MPWLLSHPPSLLPPSFTTSFLSSPTLRTEFLPLSSLLAVPARAASQAPGFHRHSTIARFTDCQPRLLQASTPARSSLAIPPPLREAPSNTRRDADARAHAHIHTHTHSLSLSPSPLVSIATARALFRSSENGRVPPPVAPFSSTSSSRALSFGGPGPACAQRDAGYETRTRGTSRR